MILISFILTFTENSNRKTDWFHNKSSPVKPITRYTDPWFTRLSFRYQSDTLKQEVFSEGFRKTPYPKTVT